jgi:hypothetical protein
MTLLSSVKSMGAAALIAAGTLFAVSAASAGPLPSLDLLKGQAAEQSAVEHVVGPYGPCVWSRYRGWHRNGLYGTWRSCSPGAEWRYERRCWIGPRGVRHCRFYG